ncbi:alkaline phosphatase family protein [Burkholderia mayonis]|uniref:phospholipase C n=1 Tax=Burkholderia mayonis TaxID=1385591 RepID=A0A1B4G6E9_9BURK|nr:alkaline phosphatase family protein [Burkholderia mayonis]AOJ11494.1 phosphoesterase [Burkholderia mayonis]KVE46468.1 phosphoesterase [Burkholderia mayonis]
MSQDQNNSSAHFHTRRRLISAAAAALASSVGLASCGGDSVGGGSGGAQALAAASSGADTARRNASSPQPPQLPPPGQSGIDHVVLVVMENRSFDHYFGWLPGANGKQAGLQFQDAFGDMQNTFRLAISPLYGFQGCNFADPDHSYTGGRIQMNGGKMDGWLKTPDTNRTAGDLFPIGYYLGEDLAFFGPCAQNWTVCDQYHCGILAETYPNRFYLMCGETDRIVNTSTVSQLPTIFDRFAAKGVSSTYYYGDVPFTALFGTKYLGISKLFSEFLVDAAAGTLPAFSYVDPRFLGENPEGVSGDDHPNSDIRNGQAFLNQIYDAVRNGPGWQRTLLVVTYDEWGGFFDHVAPFQRPVSTAEALLGNDGYLGFRVPLVLIGPTARRGYVSHWQFDPSSIHQFLMWRFGLDPLGVRSTLSNTNSIAYALNFSSPDYSAPAFSVPTGPFGNVCSNTVTGALTSAAGIPGISDLRAAATTLGFPSP